MESYNTCVIFKDGGSQPFKVGEECCLFLGRETIKSPDLDLGELSVF